VIISVPLPDRKQLPETRDREGRLVVELPGLGNLVQVVPGEISKGLRSRLSEVILPNAIEIRTADENDPYFCLWVREADLEEIAPLLAEVAHA
jgi:hypothetical protein